MLRRHLLGLALAAPSLHVGRTQAARPVRVVLVNPGRSDEAFWLMAEAAMRAAAASLSIELEVLHANRSRERIRDLTLSVIARETPPSALVIANEEQTARELLVAADRRALPTVLIVTDLSAVDAAEIGAPRTRLPSFLGSVTPDNVAAGRRLAQETLRATAALPSRSAGGWTRMLAIGGDQITNSSVGRLEGLQAELRDRTDATLDRVVFGNWSSTEARTLTARHLEWARRSGRIPSAVWAASDAMALGAMAALEAADLLPGRDVAVGGVNWSREAVEAVTAGRMAVTVGGHFFCGAWALVALRDHCDGHGFDSEGHAQLRAPLSPVDRQTSSRYLAALGDGNWGRVDFRRFTRGVRGTAAEYDFSLDAVLAASGA